MSTAGDFINALKHEVRQGNIPAATEHHLRREFQSIGFSGPDARMVEAVTAEIARLEREVGTLRRLRAAVFGVA